MLNEVKEDISPLNTTLTSFSPGQAITSSGHEDDEKASQETTTYTIAAKHILKLSGPYTLAIFVGMASEVATIKMLSTLGKENLAASGLINAVQTFYVNPIKRILYPLTIFAGEEKAESSSIKPNVGKIFRQGLVLASVLSIPVIAVTVFSGPILVSIGQEEELAYLVQDTYRGRAIGVLFDMGLTAVQNVALGLSETTPVIASTIFTAALNLGLSYGFGLGAGYGITGFGYALALSSMLNFVGFMLFLKLNKNFVAYKLFSCERMAEWFQLNKAIKAGLKNWLQTMADAAGLAIPAIYIGWLGQDSLSAQQIVISYFYMFSMPYNAVSQALLGFISETNKKMNPDKIMRYSKVTLALCLSTSALGLIIFSSASERLASFFIDIKDPKNNHMLALIEPLFIVHGVELLVDCLKVVFSGLLWGLQDMNYPPLASLVTTAICVSLGYALGFPAALGVAGIYIARDIGVTLNAALLAKRFANKIAEMQVTKPDTQVTNETKNNLPEENNTRSCWSRFFSRSTLTEEKKPMLPLSERKSDEETSSVNTGWCANRCVIC